jgi:16S rRNA (guanine527-N7)-methyltransferase
VIYDGLVDTGAISQLLQPFITLDETRLRAISKYIDLLLKWNARVNLTAVRAPEEMVRRHFGESFFAADYVMSRRAVESVIDLGSGAGFPGIPFAMLAPGVQVMLIESNQKKATFLRELISLLELKTVKVFSDRAEHYAQSAGLVTMRAVEKFDQALPLALRLAEPGGQIALMIGSSQVAAARKLAQVEWGEPVAVPGGHSRVLLVGTKKVKVE